MKKLFALCALLFALLAPTLAHATVTNAQRAEVKNAVLSSLNMSEEGARKLQVGFCFKYKDGTYCLKNRGDTIWGTTDQIITARAGPAPPQAKAARTPKPAAKAAPASSGVAEANLELRMPESRESVLATLKVSVLNPPQCQDPVTKLWSACENAYRDLARSAACTNDEGQTVYCKTEVERLDKDSQRLLHQVMWMWICITVLMSVLLIGILQSFAPGIRKRLDRFVHKDIARHMDFTPPTKE